MTKDQELAALKAEVAGLRAALYAGLHCGQACAGGVSPCIDCTRILAALEDFRRGK